MEEITFKFHGLNSRRVLFGVVLLSILTLIGFFAPIVLFDLKSPFISFLGAILSAALAMYFLGRLLRGLWTIKIIGGTMEVYYGNTLKNRFALSDLEKIHIRGWSHNKSYYSLRLIAPKNRLRIFVEGSGFMAEFTPHREMKIFAEMVSMLESYALKNKYTKKDLKKSFTHADFRNHYYLRRQNV